MAIDADVWIDRRRLKRKLTVWRVIAVLAAVAAVVAAVGRFDRLVAGRHIARVAVAGLIIDDEQRDRKLDEIAADGSVRALIVRIDSPGGTVVGGESLYQKLRAVARDKPVVAVMGELATSAAYMTAIASDHIVAREGTLTGSIGVILQTTDLTPLLDHIGIKPETVKSGPLKAQPNPLEPFSPEAREATRKVVFDLYEMFIDMVAERRKLEREAVKQLADGRVFTGRQALANGLVDALGGEDAAKDWLVKEHGLDPDTPVRDVELGGPERQLRDLFDGLVGKALFPERLRLDGVISLWHPVR